MQKKFFLGMLGIFLLLVSGCGKKSAPNAPADLPEDKVNVAPEIVAWLKENAIPFNTSKAGSGFADLMPLKPIIGNARIVALGEATHGTKEFFEMKHRLLEFLVKEMGFNTFAIEATWPEANLVNDYVHTSAGDPVRLLAGLYFWTWKTQEVLEMIYWMWRHNQNPGGTPKVSFFGFDMQFPKMAMDNVIAYLRKVDPSRVAWADSLFFCFRVYEANQSNYTNAPQTVKTECRGNSQKVYDDLISKRAAYETQSSSAEFARALQSARVALQGEDVFSGNFAARDRYMAENAGWLLDQAGPGAKIVLWAHNYEYNFRGADIPRMFINLQNLERGLAASDWLFGPRRFRSIGAIYDDANPNNYFYSARLPEEFDVIIYFQKTSPSVLLPF